MLGLPSATTAQRYSCDGCRSIGASTVPAQRVRVPLDQRVVGLVDRALLERPLEHGVGALRLGDHHQPAGADVEPVHDALPLGRAAGRDPVARRGQAADHGGAGPARAGVGGHPDRLVDDHDVVVVVHDGHPRHRLRDDLRYAGGRRDHDVEPRAGADPVGLHAGRSVDEHVPRADQLGRASPGEAEEPAQRRVEAFAREPVGDGQLSTVGHDVDPRRPGRTRRPCGRVSRRRGRARPPTPSSTGSGCRRRTTSSPRSTGRAGRCPPRRGRSVR